MKDAVHRNARYYPGPPMKRSADQRAHDWRGRARARSSAKARRRALAVLLLAGLAVILAAAAAFMVPMLITG